MNSFSNSFFHNQQNQAFSKAINFSSRIRSPLELNTSTSKTKSVPLVETDIHNISIRSVISENRFKPKENKKLIKSEEPEAEDRPKQSNYF
jgi:hypothetical protein